MSIKQNYDTISRLQAYIGGVIPPFEIMDAVLVSHPLLIIDGVCYYNCISDQVIKDGTDILDNKIRMVATIDVYNRVMNISMAYTDEDAFRNKSVYVCLCRDDGGCVTIGNMEHFVKVDADHGTSIYVPTENMTEEIISPWKLLLIVVNDGGTGDWSRTIMFSRDDKLYCEYKNGILDEEYRVLGMCKFKLFESSHIWTVQLTILDEDMVYSITTTSECLVVANNLKLDIHQIPTISFPKVTESMVKKMIV